MSQALYRKWRPQSFEDVVGQDHVVRTLRNALTSERVHHAYLFAGPRGTGKTTSARLLAKAVNCLDPDPQNRPCNSCSICQAVNEGRLLDLIEIDAASNTGVDDVRELRERVGFRPNEARYKVYVVDEVHMLSNAAFNALLKTLEEPPPHAIFVLATTEPHKIPATILSRCQRLDFRRIPLAVIADRLERIAESEAITAERDALVLVARQATGSMRDAESLLDQLASYDEGGITVAEVRAALGTGADESVIALAEALASGDVAGGLEIINDAVERGADPRQFARQLVEHMRALLLTRLGSEEIPLYVTEELYKTFQAQAELFDMRQLAQCVRIFSQAATEARAAWQPQLPLELAFMEAAMPASGLTDVEGGGTPPPPTGPAVPQTPKGGSKPKRAQETASAAASRPQETASVAASRPQEIASTAASQPPEASPQSSASSLTLEQVRGLWPDVLRAIRTCNLPLEALLRSGEAIEVTGDTVIIGFAHKFHRVKVEEDVNRREIEDAIAKLVGGSVRVRCVSVSDDTDTVPAPVPTPQIPPEQAPDELVQAAVEKLGARIGDQALDLG